MYQALFQALYIYIYIKSLILTTALGDGYCCYPHFTGEKLSQRALKEIAQSDMISRRQIWVMNRGIWPWRSYS